eukprot:TRINITY_DN13382_c0_g1::TRINITY_DN13382_c0_g1_i1::g.9635::m.9635 TRINITY_DN13382_c0_g1::TRINITY_DN13382_c0_g1_i1::g.9635  ORF type:complete len:157 (+),score=9.62 TRINITY_DN13382_c0_g1_i1:122-592(+)
MASDDSFSASTLRKRYQALQEMPDDELSATALRRKHLGQQGEISTNRRDDGDGSTMLFIILLCLGLCAVFCVTRSEYIESSTDHVSTTVNAKEDVIWAKLSRYINYLSVSQQLTAGEQAVIGRLISSRDTQLRNLYYEYGGNDPAFLTHVRRTLQV